MSKLRLLDPNIVDLDTTLKSQAAGEPDDDRRDELLEQELTAVDAELAAQATETPSPSLARPAARDPVVPVPSSDTSMGVAADLSAELNPEHGAPRIGRRGMLRATSAVVLAGLTGSLVGWYVAYAWLI